MRPCGGKEMSSRFVGQPRRHMAVNLERTSMVPALGTMAGSAPGYQNSKRGRRVGGKRVLYLSTYRNIQHFIYFLFCFTIINLSRQI